MAEMKLELELEKLFFHEISLSQQDKIKML